MSKPDFVTHFVQGVEHFNAREFWEAHESWEEIWLAAESDVEQFLQGLIQVAAAYHHLQRGTFRGGVRLFDSGLARLRNFPPHFCALEREAVEKAAVQHRSWAAECVASQTSGSRLRDEDYPLLVLKNGVDPTPPVKPW